MPYFITVLCTIYLCKNVLSLERVFYISEALDIFSMIYIMKCRVKLRTNEILSTTTCALIRVIVTGLLEHWYI